MIFEFTIMTLTLIVLSIASYTDLKTREVPDWISYSFIFAASIIRILFSLQLGWQVLVSGIIGFFIAFAIALFLYFTGQWGGADSKLLMGMGIVLGADFLFVPDSWNLFLYFIALLFVGAVFGLLWSSGLAIIHYTRYSTKFKERLREYQSEHLVVIIISLMFVFIGAFWIKTLIVIGIFPLVSYYLFVHISSIEQSCFIKRIAPHKATEGDWLAQDVKVGKKIIIKATTLEKKDIRKLLELEADEKIDRIVIKEGIPFIPSFLLAYIVVLYSNSVVAYFVGILL
jgi:Flp pilus assembly protein protease CpaA